MELHPVEGAKTSQREVAVVPGDNFLRKALLFSGFGGEQLKSKLQFTFWHDAFCRGGRGKKAAGGGMDDDAAFASYFASEN